jgi:hypothetical protein
MIQRFARWLEAIIFVLVKQRLAPRRIVQDLGERSDYDGIPVVHLRGTAYERGFQHGYQCHQELLRLQQVAWSYAPETATQRLGLPSWISRLLIKPLLRVLAATYLPSVLADAKEEMQGLADGSGIPVADIVVNTLIWEVLAIVTAPKREHCSEVAVSGRHTTTGQSLLGYNYDVVIAGDRQVVEGFLALFVVSPHGAYAYVTPNAIGSIGINTAMNTHIAFGWDNAYLNANAPRSPHQGSYMVALRDVALHCDSVATTFERLRQEPRCESDISVVIDRTHAAVVELAGTVAAFRDDSFAVWSANQLTALRSFDRQAEPNSRESRYTALLSTLKAPVNIEDIACILRDTGAPAHERQIANPATTFAVIYDLANYRLWVAFGGSPAVHSRMLCFDGYGRRYPDADIAAYTVTSMKEI